MARGHELGLDSPYSRHGWVKTCEICGRDISNRPGPAKYCVLCSLLGKRQRAKVKAGLLTPEQAMAQRSSSF